MNINITRRGILAAGALAAMTRLRMASAAGANKAAFKFCLNTSTIMGQKLPLPQQIEVARKAGYDAIEPWVRDVDTYAKSGKLADAKKQIADSGLTVENAIGFAQWIVDDEAARKKGMDQFKREMELVAQIGAKRMAAPPGGATNQADFDLNKAAERYRVLVDMGQPLGITPQLEVWGHSKVLGTINDAIFVAAKSGAPTACILPDVFHMYRGNVPFADLRKLSATTLQMIPLND
jgi:2-keto-myo-inositol isomerase